MKLSGRRVLIAGGASGIGRATAEIFHAEGAAVAVLDRDGEGLSQVVASLSQEGAPPVASAKCDLTDEAAVQESVLQMAEALGGLDGIVVSVGIDLLKPFTETSASEWQRVLDVNLTAPFHLCKTAVPHLQIAGGGTIVQISSGAALRPLEARTAYCASKAGLVMFAKALAVDLANANIRVNAICPGIIDTPLFRQSFESHPDPHAELERIKDRYLIRRIGQPEDIAKAALYLSSSDSMHVTGTTLSVDGGRSFH